MSYQVLSRKWRPKNFSDVIGQPHIVKSLQQAILRNKVGHAYIFAGTRGVGKTSLARIFAKALRCENRLPDGNPCCQCTNCRGIDNGTSFDVLELDGASNNKVENVRDLIDGVNHLPTSGSTKIYILDEVHMLTNNAFNALLKTLEEPPSHVAFILATTEPDKLLGTVLSRCQRFDFRNVSVEDLQAHVESIAKAEHFSFQPKALLERVCEQGQGSVRDTLSLIDQVLSYCPERVITEDILVSSLGLIRLSSLKAMTEMIIEGRVGELSNLYTNLLSENADIKKLALSLLNHFFSIIRGVHQKSPLIHDLISPSSILFIQPF